MRRRPRKQEMMAPSLCYKWANCMMFGMLFIGVSLVMMRFEPCLSFLLPTTTTNRPSFMQAWVQQRTNKNHHNVKQHWLSSLQKAQSLSKLYGQNDLAVEEEHDNDNNDKDDDEPTTMKSDNDETTTTTIMLAGSGSSSSSPEVINVGNPQRRTEIDMEWTVDDILDELTAIQRRGNQTYCILGSRHCSYMHEQIVEMLAFALVLSGNKVLTSGARGTNAAAVRGALRADTKDQRYLTVAIPQSFDKQTDESKELLSKVAHIIEFPQHDHLPLEEASKLCNSFLINQTDHLFSFAFHHSHTLLEANAEARRMKRIVTTLYLD